VHGGDSLAGGSQELMNEESISCKTQGHYHVIKVTKLKLKIKYVLKKSRKMLIMLQGVSANPNQE
jgi:hypothetical protein